MFNIREKPSFVFFQGPNRLGFHAAPYFFKSSNISAVNFMGANYEDTKRVLSSIEGIATYSGGQFEEAIATLSIKLGAAKSPVCFILLAHGEVQKDHESHISHVGCFGAGVQSKTIIRILDDETGSVISYENTYNKSGFLPIEVTRIQYSSAEDEHRINLSGSVDEDRLITNNWESSRGVIRRLQDSAEKSDNGLVVFMISCYSYELKEFLLETVGDKLAIIMTDVKQQPTISDIFNKSVEASDHTIHSVLQKMQEFGGEIDPGHVFTRHAEYTIPDYLALSESPIKALGAEGFWQDTIAHSSS